MITLAIDASTYTGDVAVVDGTRVLAEANTAMRGADEERLMPTVARTLFAASVGANEIRRVVCGAGPGSFTSLRIAGAIAKGIATGVGCPLYAVSSMALIVGGASLVEGTYLVAIDALRGELYVGLFDVDAMGVPTEREPARLVAAAEIETIASAYDAKVVSPSASVGEIVASPRAQAVTKLDAMLARQAPVDVGAWEPSYGRLAEAQVKWESTHGRRLPTG